MRRKELFPFLAAAMLFAGSLSAGPVTPKQAAVVARNFLAAVSGVKQAPPLGETPVEWCYRGIYLFVAPGGGWVMVSADDAFRPVLGYSVAGAIDPADMPLSLTQWLDTYQRQMDAVLEARRDGDGVEGRYARDSREWQSLLDGMAAKEGNDGMAANNDGMAAKDDGMAPLLTTRWDQYYPYNALCPTGVVTGCAATAQAQMMKFWNFPAFGNGSHSYVPPRVGVEQSADFGHTLYDWAYMRDSASQYATSREVEAVATLMYHCGVSLEMSYGTASDGGSAALGLVGFEGVASIDNSLKDNFCYSRDMEVRSKGAGYTNDEWRAMIVAELNLGRPLIYTGTAEAGGHGFVCDGYDSREYLHFNFGWSGIGDGYYTVDSISPGVGGAGGNGSYTFNMSNMALFGAVPEYAMRVSDTLFCFLGDGGGDSLLFGVNDTIAAPWSVASDADWLTVDAPEFDRAGWVRFRVARYDGSGERVAYLVFTQGSETRRVKVVQLSVAEEEMCPLTVVMESTHGSGWRGDACLTLESPGGFVYGTARLEEGERDSVVILVGPKDVYSVWHSGGATDRYVNYWVRNQYGEDFVVAEYAYRTGGTDLIVWPCGHVGVADVGNGAAAVDVFPNPTKGTFRVDAPGLQRIEVVDLGGRKVAETTARSCDISALPRGHYFVRIVTTSGTTVRRVVKR